MTGGRLPSARRGIAVGRYVLHDELASGGMATVHLARMRGEASFSRVVAVKALHVQFATDPDFVAMFLDEARLTSRIHHPNVVPMLDVVARDGELYLVMDYVRGEALSRLIGKSRAEDHLPVLLAIMVGVLSGLHAAHEAQTETGEPLHIVHRDVSPQNVLVGVDGTPRLLDFGVAKAAVRANSTHDGQIKGKLRYMAPEQLAQGDVDRRTDVFAASAVLWEMLAGRRLFASEQTGALVKTILDGEVTPLLDAAPWVPPKIAEIVHRGLARDAADRHPTALAMATALEQASSLASAREVGEWVRSIASEALGRRDRMVAELESSDIGAVSLDKAPIVAGDEAAAARADALTARVEMPDLGAAVPVATARLDVPATTSTDPVVAPPAGGRGRALAGIAALVVSIGAVSAWSLSRGASVDGAAAAPTAGVETQPVASARSAPIAPTAAPTASATPSPDVAGSPAASSAPPVAVTGARARPAGPRTKSPALREGAKRGGAKPGCDPPYTVDAQGTKTFKADCL